MGSLQKSEQNQRQTLSTGNQAPTILSTLSKREIAIAKVLVDVNNLIAFKMEAEEIGRWTKHLNRLVEKEEMKKLPFLMDCFMRGEIAYDRNEGIQNIFRGLKLIAMEEGKFRVLKPIY